MKLLPGEQVVNQYGVRGVVVNSGYGTQPYQVQTEFGTYFSYILEDGTSPITTIVWKSVGREGATYEHPHLEHYERQDHLTTDEESSNINETIKNSFKKLTKRGA